MFKSKFFILNQNNRLMTMYTAFNKVIKNQEVLVKIVDNVKSTSKAVSLMYNLKKYKHLVGLLETGRLDPVFFATKMTADEMSGQKIKNIEPNKLVSNELPDGLFKCQECKSMKTEHYEVHNIETTVTYITCLFCGIKWKI